MTNKHSKSIWLQEYSGCLASHCQEVRREIIPQRQKILKVWTLKSGIKIYNYKWGKIKQQNVIRKLSQSQNEMQIIHILKVCYWLKLRLPVCSNVEKIKNVGQILANAFIHLSVYFLTYILFNLLFWEIIHNLILEHPCTTRINSLCS